MAYLKDIAGVVRSKNAGPFLITFDVMFAEQGTYEKVKATGVINPALFARLYGVPEDRIVFHHYDSAYSFKATIPRIHSSGDVKDGDVYGAQQHAPLLDVNVPIE